MPQASTGERLTYSDVFTGLVFAHPLDEQYLQQGVPGYFAGFEEEMLRRASLVSEEYRRKTGVLINLEKMGLGIRKSELPWRTIESMLELCQLGLSSMGLLIGISAFTLGRLHGYLTRNTAVGKT